MESKTIVLDGQEYELVPVKKEETRTTQPKTKYPLSVDEIKGRDWYISSGGYTARCLDLSKKSDLSSEALAEAFLALIQLKELCNECNRIDGKKDIFQWDNQNRYYRVIIFMEGDFRIGENSIFGEVLSFYKDSTAEWFLETHKELIEKTRPLYE